MIDGDDLELFTRSVRNATERHTGADLDDALGDIGWHDALGADARSAVSVLFELQGRANATSAALDHVLRAALGTGESTTPGIVLPALGDAAPPGDRGGDRLAVHGLGSPSLAAHDSAVVVGRAGDKHISFEVPVAELAVRSIEGIDPWLGLVEVTGAAAATELGPVDWHAAAALGQLAVAHELVGASRRMLELAREHALERIQFGRPISAFQAVRHRLAETLVAIETAEAGIDAAWHDGTPQSAAMAKALAGRGARVTARHCQQVLAGIGFTTEHDLHRYVRRIFVLDELLGSARTLTKALGDELLRTRQLPPLPPL